MSHRARHQLLALPGIIFLVLFPIILSLWIAFLWAKSEVNNQLRTFAQLALDKSELVIRQADLVSDAAERYQGQVCTPAHQKRMLNIIRGYLYINELIYARDNHFLCSSLIAPVNGYTIAPADYKREPNVSIYYYRDTPFFSGYKMTYMQRGNYVAVINPLFWSEVMSDDPTLQWGVYDTVTKTFFSLSKEASAATFSPLIHLKDLTVQRNGYLYATVYSTKRPIAAIVATSYQRLITHFYNHLIFALPAGILGSLVLLLPGTYVRPHRHPHTFELLLPLRGRFVVLNFDDRGTVTHRAILGETCTVLEMAAGTWHAVLSLDTGGIIFEVKHGGYQPVAADDYAHWAPAEGEPGTTELMAWYAQAQVGDSTFAV